jgi:hypothetical protein
MRRLCVSFLALACGCGAAVPEARGPGATSRDIPALRCENAPPPAIVFPAKGTESAPKPGRPSSRALSAQRLFESEKWAEAAEELRQVANGEAGDDEGNRQLAKYHLAITAYRLRRAEKGGYERVVDAFRGIARAPRHLKHRESLLWLAKLWREAPEAFRGDELASFGLEEVERLNNPNQRELYDDALFLAARGHFEHGEYADAVDPLQTRRQGQPLLRARRAMPARIRGGE